MSDRARSLAAIAEAEGLSDRYVSHLLPLAFLAPDIITAVLAGAQPVDLTAEALTKRTDLPLAWAEQKALLGFARAYSSAAKPNRPTCPQRKNGGWARSGPTKAVSGSQKECAAVQTAAECRELHRSFEPRLNILLNRRLAGGGRSLERTRLYAQVPC